MEVTTEVTSTKGIIGLFVSVILVEIRGTYVILGKVV